MYIFEVNEWHNFAFDSHHTLSVLETAQIAKYAYVACIADDSSPSLLHVLQMLKLSLGDNLLTGTLPSSWSNITFVSHAYNTCFPQSWLKHLWWAALAEECLSCMCKWLLAHSNHLAWSSLMRLCMLRCACNCVHCISAFSSGHAHGQGESS